MFTKAQQIDRAFRQARSFCLAFLLCCLLIALGALFWGYRLAVAANNKIYILAQGKVLDAYASERKDNIPVEARDHINSFHHYFFSLDPDEKVIAAHMAKALYLSDESARKQYDNLKESGYFTNLISGNISQDLTIDSIELNVDRYPYYFRCTAKEKLTRTSSVLTRSLVTEGVLRNVARSDHNPHGFLIERWLILENNDIKTENR